MPTLPRQPFAIFLALAFALAPIVAAGETSTIFIVRHAEKADTGEKDPDLSEAGRARAELLGKMLKDANIETIYATEFKRTQQTATALARTIGIETTIVPASETASVAEKLKAARGNALVVGHSNSVPELIKALEIPTQITINDTDYDNLFIVVRDKGSRLIRLHY